MVDQRIIDAVKPMLGAYPGLKAHEVYGVITFCTGGIAGMSLRSASAERVIKNACSQTLLSGRSLRPSNVLNLFAEMFNDTIPVIRFNADSWKRESHEFNSDDHWALLSFDWGISLRTSTQVLKYFDCYGSSNVYRECFLLFGSSLDHQVRELMIDMQNVKENLGPGDNFIVSYAAKLSGRRDRVVSLTPEARKLFECVCKCEQELAADVTNV